MAVNEIHLGDIGTIFEITLLDEGSTIVDISSATVTKDIKFQKPDGTLTTKPAAFKTDGTDGILQYTTVADDLDMTGFWTIQAYVVLTSWTGHSDVSSFQVHANLV